VARFTDWARPHLQSVWVLGQCTLNCVPKNAKIMRTTILMLAFTAAIGVAHAQNQAEDTVKMAVSSLFSGMLQADSALVASAFWPEAVLQTILATPQGAMVKTDRVAAFAQSVGRAKPGSLHEKIEFGACHIDGDLASVWTPYQFYLNGTLRHSGVNSFQLVRIRGVWKIQYLIDTRLKPKS
jgi:hypothetical protein